MKLKLTPQLAYLIGFWKGTRTKEGIGVSGNEERLSIFVKTVLELGLTEPTKLLASSAPPELSDEEKETMPEEDPFAEEVSSVYFYHGSYRKFFQKVIEDELDRFQYKNEYSSNFLAGLLDSVGVITEDGKVYLSKCTQKDEMLLSRLGFNPLRRGKKVYFSRPIKFLVFVKPFTKKYAKHPAFSKIQLREEAF